MTPYAREKAACAERLFRDGHTCSQAICLAFASEMGVDADVLLRLAAPFGGGMGRLREVCGAVSGGIMVLGAIYGQDTEKNHCAKSALYAHVQAFAARVRAEHGSIVCRELLGTAGTDNAPTPEQRSKEYYQKRPCPKLIASVAAILAAYLEEQEKGTGEKELP